jgi:hypothetical protein
MEAGSMQVRVWLSACEFWLSACEFWLSAHVSFGSART